MKSFNEAFFPFGKGHSILPIPNIPLYLIFVKFLEYLNASSSTLHFKHGFQFSNCFGHHFVQWFKCHISCQFLVLGVEESTVYIIIQLGKIATNSSVLTDLQSNVKRVDIQQIRDLSFFMYCSVFFSVHRDLYHILMPLTNKLTKLCIVRLHTFVNLVNKLKN